MACESPRSSHLQLRCLGCMQTLNSHGLMSHMVWHAVQQPGHKLLGSLSACVNITPWDIHVWHANLAVCRNRFATCQAMPHIVCTIKLR